MEDLPKDKLLAIANAIKAHTEGTAKAVVADHIRDVRAYDVAHNGVDPVTFWQLVEKVTGLKPKVDETPFKW